MKNPDFDVVDLETFTDIPPGTRIEGIITVNGKLHHVELRIGVDAPKLTAKEHIQNVRKADEGSAQILHVLRPSKADYSLITSTYLLVLELDNQEIPNAHESDEGPDLESAQESSGFAARIKQLLKFS